MPEFGLYSGGMMDRVLQIISKSWLMVSVFAASPALAQMGAAPSGPGGVYGGFTIGYTHTNQPVTELTTFLPTYQLEIDPDGGLEGGVFFGGVLAAEFMGLKNFRIEGRVSTSSSNDDDFIPTAGAPSFVNPDGSNFISIGTATPFIGGQQESTIWRQTLAVKGDLYQSEDLTVPVGIELFAAQTTDTAKPIVSVSGNVIVRSDIDAEYYGAMALIEPEFRVSEMFGIVARLAGGFYAYDVDGKFSGFFTTTLSDSLDGIGGRVEGMLGLKTYLSSAFTITLFGGVDYWSDTPHADWTQTLGVPTTLGKDDMVRLMAGVTATVAFGGQ